GRAPPARMRSTVFCRLLSTNAPFLTERAIATPLVHFQLPIANCRFQEHSFVSANSDSTAAKHQLAIGNWKSAMLFHSAIAHDHFLRALVAARLITTRRLSPGGNGISAARGLAFSAAVRMVHRIHGHAANVRPDSFPAGTPCLTVRYVFVFDVADLAYRGHANHRHLAHFAGRHAQLR